MKASNVKWIIFFNKFLMGFLVFSEVYFMPVAVLCNSNPAALEVAIRKNMDSISPKITVFQ